MDFGGTDEPLGARLGGCKMEGTEPGMVLQPLDILSKLSRLGQKIVVIPLNSDYPTL